MKHSTNTDRTMHASGRQSRARMLYPRIMGVRSRLVLFRFSLSHGYHRSLARRPRPSVRGCCKELERDWALDGMSWLQSSCLSLPLKFEERLAPWQICVPTPHSLISAVSVGLALVFLGLFLFLVELALFLGLFLLLVELTLLSRLGICPDTRELPSVSWQLQAQMSDEYEDIPEPDIFDFSLRLRYCGVSVRDQRGV